jgi:hypothetical protein
MKKKLQVFVSSTYTDMLAERQGAVEAILTSGSRRELPRPFVVGIGTAARTVRREEYMFNGSVIHGAFVRGKFQFTSFDFNPNQPGVEKVTLEAPDGDCITSTTYLNGVVSQDEGRKLAATIIALALNRLAFQHGIAIEDAKIMSDRFVPVNPPDGTHHNSTTDYVYLAEVVEMAISISPAELRQELEHSNPPGERYFGLFRSAILSPSPVEAFMHVYNLLLMLHNDSQADLDAFIVSQDPSVPQTQAPKRKPGVMETIYTRLRNEFAHTRQGVNLATTKADMAGWLGRLRGLTQRAIVSKP